MLLRIDKVADLLGGEILIDGNIKYYIDGIIQINNHKGQWIRGIEDWKPKSRKLRVQFTSLAHHLFAKYEVPAFMDLVWFRSDKGGYKYRNWYVHLGRGKNIRTANTPIKLTKKVAHYFLQAPDDYSIEEAIKFGEIKSLKGDRRLVEAILSTPLARGFRNNEFWNSVYKFFIENPFIDRAQVGPIIDYINNQKYLSWEEVVAPGVAEIRLPPQPNFSMTGRDPNTLLLRVDAWHRQISKIIPSKNLFFKKSGINPFVKGKKEKWVITELLSGTELMQEGREMHHCVASYARSCALGKCSIWSMSFNDGYINKKCITIEVLKDGRIVQCRGRYNRLPSATELNVIIDWALKEKLTLAKYVTAI